MKHRHLLPLVFALASWPAPDAFAEPDAPASLLVHEWGTLTTRHFEGGLQTGGMNLIEPGEAVPDFVHRIEDDVLRSLDKSGEPTDANASVNLRLETPILYFYPAASFDPSQTLDVKVEFLGGLLNEFYPDAITTWEGIRFQQHKGAERAGYSELTEHATGTLQWPGLSFADPAPGPHSNAPQWLAPRRVNAADLRARNGESERFLFYRGVARLPSLLRTRHDAAGQRVTLLSPKELPPGELVLPQVWLVRVGPDAGLAFEELGSLTLGADAEAILSERSTDLGASSAREVAAFRASLRAALIGNGLFADEADAMLDTWEHAYFRSAGTRLMFIVPRAWIDRHLPLTLSVPAQVVRVYLGRIDLHGM